MSGRIALIGGQGWPATETVLGLPTLQKRLQAEGFDVQSYSRLWREQIRDWLIDTPSPIALIGDSLGAGAAAIYAKDLAPRLVQFVGGFQPSAWDPVGEGPTTDRIIPVSINVTFAYCIWDPVFLDTGGLGNAHYVIAPGQKTSLSLTEHRGAHPDDWGYAQDLMVSHCVIAMKN